MQGRKASSATAEARSCLPVFVMGARLTHPPAVWYPRLPSGMDTDQKPATQGPGSRALMQGGPSASLPAM